MDYLFNLNDKVRAKDRPFTMLDLVHKCIAVMTIQHWNEMSGLGKLVDDYPDGVKLVAGERQTHNEIHTDVFPFPGMDTQRLQQSCRPHMISLDPSTCVAFHNIASSLMFHTGPPELCLQIMIHLCAAWVDGIFRSVSFIKYLLV
jgi:hypothetical protein